MKLEKPKPKNYRVTISEKPHFRYSGGVIDMNHCDFEEWAGGYLAVALFKGEFKGAVHTVLDMAFVRGEMNNHKLLLEEARQKEFKRKNKHENANNS